MPMRILELACLAIVVTYFALRLRQSDAPKRTAARLALLTVAAFVGEDSCIRAYGFYSYSPEWSIFVDKVPILIALIWPVVIDSATVLARCFTTHRTWLPLVAGAIVLGDASLIEPVATRSGLWTWTAPGLFDVPLIGILGWALFTTCAVAWLERVADTIAEVALVAVAPVATHLLLVALWWGLFRPVTQPVSAPHAAIGLWIALALLAGFAWRANAGARVPVRALLMRLPGASFFLVLLAILHRDDMPLVAWTLAFVPPYLVLLAGRRPTLGDVAPTGAAERVGLG